MNTVDLSNEEEINPRPDQQQQLQQKTSPSQSQKHVSMSACSKGQGEPTRKRNRNDDHRPIPRNHKRQKHETNVSSEGLSGLVRSTDHSNSSRSVGVQDALVQGHAASYETAFMIVSQIKEMQTQHEKELKKLQSQMQSQLDHAKKQHEKEMQKTTKERDARAHERDELQKQFDDVQSRRGVMEQALQIFRKQLDALKVYADDQDLEAFDQQTRDAMETKLEAKLKDVIRASAKKEAINNCVVCQDAPSNHLFEPCAHVCVCGDCKQQFETAKKKCPMCRTEVKQVKRVYMPY